MKIVKVKGGLGNQLFQYCFAKRIEQLSHEEIKLDMSTYNQTVDDPIRKPRLLKCNISLPIAKQDEINKYCFFEHRGNLLSTKYRIGIGIEAAFNRKYFFEKNRGYTDPITILNYSYFDGYWQSWKTVEDVWESVKQELVPNYAVSNSTKNMIDTVKSTNSVFLGVRRGDYTAIQTHYGTFGNDYFQKAIKYVEERIDSPVFYIFSNDIPWVKENIDFTGRTVVYREPEEVIDDFEDLLIMAACRHSIIINSTYHWWGARLNDTPEKIVVAPQKWFFDDKPIDIVPPHWIRIEV